MFDPFLPSEGGGLGRQPGEYRQNVFLGSILGRYRAIVPGNVRFCFGKKAEAQRKYPVTPLLVLDLRETVTLNTLKENTSSKGEML